MFLSAAFRLNCSVDDSGVIAIDCQEVNGEIDSEQLYCIYDSGPRESCMATITYRLPCSFKNSAPLNLDTLNKINFGKFFLLIGKGHHALL